MLHKIQVFILILLVPLGALLLYSQSTGVPIREIFVPASPIAIVGEIPMRVEIVETAEERAQGLSGRDELKADGMLFVFDTTDYHGIWMKDMRFPIDIIWIDESFTIIGVERSVQPNSYPRTYRPPEPARYAIETDDRYTETFGIGVGQSVRLPLQIEGVR